MKTSPRSFGPRNDYTAECCPLTVKPTECEQKSSLTIICEHHLLHFKSVKYRASEKRKSETNKVFIMDGGIMRQNSANYVKHILGLCAEFLPIMCAIFSAMCYIFFLLKGK